MDDKLKYFIFSQNSINTFKLCPTKFKYKYIDNINWQSTEIENRSYYESLKHGRDFHMLCERYFNNIPLGNKNLLPSDFMLWIKKIEKLIPLKKDKLYLPEYEIRCKVNGKIISAKYDLVIIDKNKIEIWDWKTEAKKIEYKNVDERMQTLVYMYLAKEVIPKLYRINIDELELKMMYYQPRFYDEPVTILYNEQKHYKYQIKLKSLLDDIISTEYHVNCAKNINHCKYCEYNNLCNKNDVKYNSLEEKIYGS